MAVMSYFGHERRAGAMTSEDRGDQQVRNDRERRVREHAYAIWEREGRPHGRDREHWRQAEAEIGGGGGGTSGPGEDDTDDGAVGAAEPDAGSTITMSPGGRGGRWRHLVEGGAAASAGG